MNLRGRSLQKNTRSAAEIADSWWKKSDFLHCRGPDFCQKLQSIKTLQLNFGQECQDTTRTYSDNKLDFYLTIVWEESLDFPVITCMIIIWHMSGYFLHIFWLLSNWFLHFFCTKQAVKHRGSKPDTYGYQLIKGKGTLGFRLEKIRKDGRNYEIYAVFSTHCSQQSSNILFTIYFFLVSGLFEFF